MFFYQKAGFLPDLLFPTFGHLGRLFHSKTKEAYGACGQISAGQGWALWYLRPKVHMFEHVLLRDCN
jgi:hypothetical protein